MPHIELLLLIEIVLLIDRNQLAMNRKFLEERSCGIVSFNDEVMSAFAFQKVAHLEAARACSYNDVFKLGSFHSGKMFWFETNSDLSIRFSLGPGFQLASPSRLCDKFS